jgi:lipopolysaccharide heptosyltransferase I
VLNLSPQRILIVKPSSLGDIVHALPVLAAIHCSFPASQIDWVVAKGFEGLLEQHPMLHHLWIIQKDRWKNIRSLQQTAAEIRELFRSLGAQHYDLTIDLQGLLRSGLITHATHAPVRLGFAEAREGSRMFYTHTVSGGRDVHAVDRYLKIAAEIGCKLDTVVFPFPIIEASAQVRQIRESLGTYAVLVPGARWMTKRWPVDRFASLAAMVPIPSIVIGASGDAELGRYIEQQSGGKARSLAGKTTLQELIALIQGARFVVTNDSGPMHIAAAAGVPTVALFGPTSPKRTGPYGVRNVVLTSTLACSPCYKRQCQTLRCLEEISVAQVIEAIQTLGC